MIRAFQGPMTRVERTGLIAGLVLAAGLMWPLRGFVTDDTYAHLQYARHLAGGQGLVFNQGERVYGCTSPLWVALLADAMALGLDGVAAARLIGVLATLASVALFLQLMRRTLRSPVLRALATVAWAADARMLRWSTSGMETSLAVALTLAGFVAFTEGRHVGSRPVRTGALWALAALTRPELVFLLILWSGTLIVDAHNRDGLRRMVFGMLPPALIYGLWLLFTRVYFGTFWPQPLSAGPAKPLPLAVQLQHLGEQARILVTTEGVLIAMLALALLFGGRRVWMRPQLAQQVLPWLWIVALPALYCARGVDVVGRHLLVLIPVLAWLCWRTAERWWIGPEPSPARLVRAGIAGTAVCVLALAQNVALYQRVIVPEVLSDTERFEQSLVQWGRWFGRFAPREAVIATPDIGAIGFLGQRRVLDVSGLITPQIVPALEREPRETVVANFRFASFARPLYLVDRAARPYDLQARSPFAASLVPLGTAPAPDNGAASERGEVYTVYRVDWANYDPSLSPP